MVVFNVWLNTGKARGGDPQSSAPPSLCERQGGVEHG